MRLNAVTRQKPTPYFKLAVRMAAGSKFLPITLENVVFRSDRLFGKPAFGDYRIATVEALVPAVRADYSRDNSR